MLEKWAYSDEESVMPASRTEMVFREYMQPMSLELKEINGKKTKQGGDATSIPMGSVVKLKYAGIENNYPKWDRAD